MPPISKQAGDVKIYEGDVVHVKCQTDDFLAMDFISCIYHSVVVIDVVTTETPP